MRIVYYNIGFTALALKFKRQIRKSRSEVSLIRRNILMLGS